MSDYVIETVPVPAPGNEPDWRLRGLADVQAEDFRDVLGNTDLVDSAEQRAISLANQQSKRKAALVAVDPGRAPGAEAVFGGCLLVAPVTDNTHLAYVHLTVRAADRLRGVGTMLWQHALAWSRDQNRHLVLSDTVAQDEPPADAPYALAAPNGIGRIDARTPGACFARAMGFELAQVERHSTQALPLDRDLLARESVAAERAAGDDYDLVTWQGSVPDQWLDGLAQMLTAMSTDAPAGAADIREETWDAARIREREQVAAQMGYTTITAAARHRVSGELAGYTEIAVDSTNPGVAYQENTVVLAPHRGRRLGMLLKAANIARVQELAPQVRRVHTWNAEENNYMLAINVALGYRPGSVWGNWQYSTAAS